VRLSPTRRRGTALGSVLNHVLLHQTVIGEEALLQLAMVGETPDLLVGCTVVAPTSADCRSRSSARSWPGG
jgi:predicted alternative tryptophan synthase beta-subunit